MMVSFYQRNQNEIRGLLPARAIASPVTPVRTENQMVFESSGVQPTLTNYEIPSCGGEAEAITVVLRNPDDCSL